MSSVKPGGPKFLGPTFWRPKFLRWLSPLLLVSLGLHGLGLLVPVPEKPEEIERPEYIEPESIQVSTLPPIAQPAPEPEPPPPPPPVEEAPPPVVEPLQETFPFEEEEFREDIPPEDDLPEDDSSEEDDSDFEDPNNNQGDDSRDDDNSEDDPVTQNTYQGDTDENQRVSNSLLFSSKYPGKSIATNIPLSLTYTADKECFDPLPSGVQMGTAINTTGATEEIALFSSSGYPKIDEWIKGVLNSENLPPEAFTGLSIGSGSLPEWINDTRSNGDDPIVPAGEAAKAYALEVIVTIDGNRCDDL